MSQEVRNIVPKEVWNKLDDLNAIPRPSKKEEKIIAFMMNFGQQLGFETIKDHVGNVIIKKPASAGLENRKTIVMQSHLDMVHQKNNDTHFDFESQGIEMFVDGDWVRAKGTTLGADNGLGVATIMAVLESKTIKHPAIEALFTIDEETVSGSISRRARKARKRRIQREQSLTRSLSGKVVTGDENGEGNETGGKGWGKGDIMTVSAIVQTYGVGEVSL